MRSPVGAPGAIYRSVRRAARVTLSAVSTRGGYWVGEQLFRLMGRRPRGRELVLARVERVLVVRLDEIGDAVMTTAFLRELRANLPNAWITLLVKPGVQELFALCPHVNEVLGYNGRGTTLLGELRCWWNGFILAWRQLWPRRFDLAIVPRWDVDYYHATLIAYLSGAIWRAGYSERVIHYKQCLNSGYDRVLTHPIMDASARHEVDRGLELLRRLGGTVREEGLELWTDPEGERFAAELLASSGVHPDELLVALGPGSGAPRRTWPVDRFVELASWLRNEYHARIVVLGGRGEEPLGAEVQQNVGDAVIDLVGRTTLRQTVALLRHCRLFVGNDSGPKHMAVALGLPVVEICCHPTGGWALHATSPERFGPWGVPCTVVRPEHFNPPCTDGCESGEAHCILGVSIKQVTEAVARLLQDLSSGVVPQPARR